MKGCQFIWLAFLVHLVFGATFEVHKNQPYLIVYSGCYYGFTDAAWWTYNKTSWCKDPVAYGSVAICIKERTANDSELFKVTSTKLATTCKFKKKGIKFGEVVKNATKYLNPDPNAYFTQMANKSSKTGGSKVKHNYNPVTLPDIRYKAWYDLYNLYYTNQDYSGLFGYGIIGYWALVMILGMVRQFLVKTGLLLKLRNTVFLQKHLFLPSFFPKIKNHKTRLEFMNKYFTTVIPRRYEGLIMLGFSVLHIVALTHNWWHFPNLPSTYSYLYVKAFAIRCGIIAVAHLPFMFLFAAKNNVLSGLTGISFENFMHFHKFISRWCTLDIFLHGVCYSKARLDQGNYYSTMKSQPMIFGVVGCVAMVMMCFFAYNYIRVHYYECFYWVHMLLGIITVIGSYKHLKQYNYIEYLYAAMAVWCFDWFVKILRIIWFGLNVDSKMEVVSDDTLRLVVKKPKHRFWNAKPGQHCYIHFLLPKYFYQSHPFTVSDSTFEDDSIVFYIKKKDGITKTVFDLIKDGHKANIKVLINGPYGHSAPTYKYKNNLLIAGGNGIPGPYTHAHRLSKLVDSNKNVELIWINKNVSSIQWFQKELEFLKSSTLVRIKIFLTQETPESLENYKKIISSNLEKLSHKDSTDNSQTDDSDKEKEKTENNINSPVIVAKSSNESTSSSAALELFFGNDNFEIIAGRPDINQLMSGYLNDTDSGIKGPVAILTCGPGQLCDSLREAIIDNISGYKDGRIDFYEELQTW